MTELDNLVQPVPRDQFNGLPTTLEKRQLEFQSKTMKVDELATQCFEHGEALGTQLEVIMRSSKEAGHTIGYTNALRSVEYIHTTYPSPSHGKFPPLSFLSPSSLPHTGRCSRYWVS